MIGLGALGTAMTGATEVKATFAALFEAELSRRFRCSRGGGILLLVAEVSACKTGAAGGVGIVAVLRFFGAGTESLLVVILRCSSDRLCT